MPKIPSTIYAVFDTDGYPVTFHTNKREADQSASAHRNVHPLVVHRYDLPPHTIWHWAAKKGTVSKCSYQGRVLDDHGSTDRHPERVNCPRCLSTKAFKNAASSRT